MANRDRCTPSLRDSDMPSREKKIIIKKEYANEKQVEVRVMTNHIKFNKNKTKTKKIKCLAKSLFPTCIIWWTYALPES
jgi:hypothetical protein